ncbi:DNA-binding MarR family transcriptional regulator [Lachnospiraceae bacterium PF1-22]|uniref:MarR family winged helix-turn-helix transcriptional regulator n=1 Tax=Ohessyouella blattaphilus TaxID=2949333 RepID=UPI003E1923C2
MTTLKQELPLGILIKRINNVYEKEFNILLKNIGITSSQCAVLDFLFYTELEEVNQKDVEEALSLQNPTVTGLLKRLDEKGYILIVPSNVDRRCKSIHLTEKAYDIRRVVESSRKEIDKKLTGKLTKKEKEAVKKDLKKMLYGIS